MIQAKAHAAVLHHQVRVHPTAAALPARANACVYRSLTCVCSADAFDSANMQVSLHAVLMHSLYARALPPFDTMITRIATFADQ